MKTKNFFLLCLLLGMALTQLSAQNDQNGTGSVSMRFEDMDYHPFDIPVYCDGVLVDEITDFQLDWHYVTHYQKGTQVFCRVQLFGEGYGRISNEYFEVNEIVSQEDISWTGIEHLNLKGDEGTHYIVTLSFEGFTPTPIRAVCNKKGN